MSVIVRDAEAITLVEALQDAHQALVEGADRLTNAVCCRAERVPWAEDVETARAAYLAARDAYEAVLSAAAV
jgi:hypothetical protein